MPTLQYLCPWMNSIRIHCLTSPKINAISHVLHFLGLGLCLIDGVVAVPKFTYLFAF